MAFGFESLDTYQKATLLASNIFEITDKWPREYLFSLTDQIRRASLSVSLNIAEGFNRSKTEFRHYLDIARGSCFECVPIIDIAGKRNIITKVQKDTLYEQIEELSKMISSLKSSTNR